ncbi:hypothetical protein L596_025509 [Steinernema carpocapsae]|uniref:Checkpoint protein n=1 Tax=Steinernema carpocapsae TaxID=34508 RepID=A0A4U5M7Z6_STECR|nr:hypothetical protein L596_025509 [Steinernema carpocapsae]
MSQDSILFSSRSVQNHPAVVASRTQFMPEGNGVVIQLLEMPVLDPDTSNQPLLLIEKENATVDFYPLIKAIEFRKHCTFHVTQQALKIIVDDECFQQAVVIIDAKHFKEYHIHHEAEHGEVTFRILMQDFLEGLHVFGRDDQSPVNVLKEHDSSQVLFLRQKGNVFVKFEIKTQTLVPNLGFDIKDDEIQCRLHVNLKSSIFHDVIKDLDKSSQTVLLAVTANSIEFSTSGELGNVKVCIPKNSDLIDDFNLVNVTEIAWKYKINLMQRMVPALHCCKRASLRIDCRGNLQVQFIAEQSSGVQQNYIEFYTVPDDSTISSDEEISMDDANMV